MVLNTWSLPGAGRTVAAAALLAGTLLVWVSSGAPAGRIAAAATTPASAAIAAVTYEAEDAWMSAGLLVAHSTPGFSGTGYVTGFTRPHAELVLAVAAPADGRYGVALRYANGSASAKVLNVYTNGIAAADAALPPTGDGNWSSVQLQLPLRAGLNTITFAYERGSAGAVSIDTISVIGGSTLNGRGATIPYQEYEAEDAATNGTVIGPSRVWGTLAAEASGRRAVTLDRVGQYVEFTLANNIAIYSGRQNSVLNSLVSDTVTQGAGITVANRSFHTGGVLPLAGTIRISGNTLERTGQVDFTYGVIGALWFKADFTIDAKIVVTDDEIDDSAQEAIQFQGNGSIDNVTFDHIVVHNSPTFVFQVEADVLGGSVSNVVATHTGVAGVYNCGNTFAVRRGPGDSGWSSSRCADLPTLAAKTLQGLHR